MVDVAEAAREQVIGRYVLAGDIAGGGIATVHFGRVLGPGGFARTFAIKRLRPQFARDPDFVAMFLDEARLASRVQHPNVVSILDVVRADDELFLVMDYVVGESLSRLLGAERKAKRAVPEKILGAVLGGALRGLHAAHEATDELGQPLDIVHRDVSPQNILVGVDGVARVLDFGIAKAASRLAETRDGVIKGKLGYMAPEHMRYGRADRRADIYGMGVVLWEALAGRRLVESDNPVLAYAQAVDGARQKPSELQPHVSSLLDTLTMRAIAPEPDDRYATAQAFATALERAAGVAPATEVAAWVKRVAADALAKRSAALAEIERRMRVAAHAHGSLEDEAPTSVYVAPGGPPSDEALTQHHDASFAGPISLQPSSEALPAAPELPEWARRAKAMSATMDAAIASGAPAPPVARAIARAWSAWSLGGMRPRQIARVIDAIARAQFALRSHRPLPENEQAGAALLVAALPDERRAAIHPERVLEVVRTLRDASDAAAARRHAVVALLGWDEVARAWMDEAIDAAIAEVPPEQEGEE